MENTGKVHFEDDRPEWYIAMGDQWVGPLLAADIYQRVMRGEVSWAHYVWKQGQSEWKRICDLKNFQAAVPHQPGRDLQKEIEASTRSAGGSRATPPGPPREEGRKTWFLYFNDTQVGPFSKEEVERFLRIGKINPRVHAWCDGMANWERIQEIGAFDAIVEDLPPAAPAPASTGSSGKKGPPGGIERRRVPRVEHRGALRRPLVAKILVANDESVAAAVCRDISIGGMQVLTDRVPGKVGTRLKMNVSPSGGAEKGSKTPAIAPFVAEGVIVRVLEDGRGFSFRFDKISPGAKRSIENYIESGE